MSKLETGSAQGNSFLSILGDNNGLKSLIKAEETLAVIEATPTTTPTDWMRCSSRRSRSACLSACRLLTALMTGVCGLVMPVSQAERQTSLQFGKFSRGLRVQGLLADFITPLTGGKLVAEIPPSFTHVPERLGLFTIIVLGEAVIAAGQCSGGPAAENLVCRLC
ncbi:MAG: low temperature requirement protein A [Oscillatoria sp. Prado101]|nr:low temperature requirement protein A [Oscillatoria sp. Prado101]